MVSVVTPKDLARQFFTSDKFFLPGKTYMAYEKNKAFIGFRNKYLEDTDLKYVRLDTESHFTTIAVDIDDNILVDELEEMIEDEIIPRPICVVGTVKLTADGYAYHRPHIIFALHRGSSVRREETTREIKNGKGKGKSAYVTQKVNYSALCYYDGCRKLLCDIFAMRGLAVDDHCPHMVKSPFSEHWHVSYYGDETYSFEQIIGYSTDEIRKYQNAKLKEKREKAKADKMTKLNIGSLSLEEATLKSMHKAACYEMSKRRHVARISDEDFQSSFLVGTRNVSYFDTLRFAAYDERQFHDDIASFERSLHQIAEIILTEHPELASLEDHERQATFRSVLKWTWFKYKGRNGYKPKNVAQLLTSSTMICRSRRSSLLALFIPTKSDEKIRSAKLKRPLQTSKRATRNSPFLRLLAHQINRNTVSKYFKDGEVVLTNSPLFNALYAGAAVILPTQKRDLFDLAERRGIMEKVSAAAEMLLNTVSSGGEIFKDGKVQVSLDNLKLSLILEHFEVEPEDITFENARTAYENVEKLYERVGVKIEWGNDAPTSDNSTQRMLDSLARMEREREKQEQITNDTWQAPWKKIPLLLRQSLINRSQKKKQPQQSRDFRHSCGCDLDQSHRTIQKVS